MTQKDNTRKSRDRPGDFCLTQPIPMAELTSRYVLWCLKIAGGNKSLAARLAGITTRTVHKYVKLQESN